MTNEEHLQIVWRIDQLGDETVADLMLQATGEDWDEADSWKLKMFVTNVLAAVA